MDICSSSSLNSSSSSSSTASSRRPRSSKRNRRKNATRKAKRAFDEANDDKRITRPRTESTNTDQSVSTPMEATHLDNSASSSSSSSSQMPHMDTLQQYSSDQLTDHLRRFDPKFDADEVKSLVEENTKFFLMARIFSRKLGRRSNDADFPAKEDVAHLDILQVIYHCTGRIYIPREVSVPYVHETLRPFLASICAPRVNGMPNIGRYHDLDPEGIDEPTDFYCNDGEDGDLDQDQDQGFDDVTDYGGTIDDDMVNEFGFDDQ